MNYGWNACTLLEDVTTARGVHDSVTRVEHEAECWVSSVGRSEFYNASAAGYQAELSVRLSSAEEYHDEARLRLDGRTYRIIRTYLRPDGGIDLTLQRGE